MSRHFRSQIATSAYGIARFGLRARPAHKAHFFNRPTWAGMPGETCNRGLQTMKTKALGAEFFGTFMLMASVLGAAFYAFGAPAGPAGILGVALSIGCTVIIEAVLTAFFLIVIMGVTRKNGPAIMAPVAIGLTLTAIHIMAIPISNASVNPARSLASALYGGGEALSQVWVFWVAPILGAVIGGKLANWLLEE